jgi:hypothetical protein
MRPTTLVIIAAVALLGLFAAVDSLRGTSSAAPPQPTSIPEKQTQAPPFSADPPIEGRAALHTRLRAAAVSGTLFVTDEDCRLRALSLPGLRWVLGTGV